VLRWLGDGHRSRCHDDGVGLHRSQHNIQASELGMVYIAGGGRACCVCAERVQDKTESSRAGVEVRVESSWSRSRSRESASRVSSDSQLTSSSTIVCSLFIFFIFKRKGGHFKLLFFVK